MHFYHNGKTIATIIVFFLLLVPSTHSQIVINEIMASNNGVVKDEDGDSPDWIELFNFGETEINLAGWFLTDDPADFRKWAFPSITMPAKSYQIVFASSKDRRLPDSPLHTNFKLDAAGEYLALIQSDGRTIVHAFTPAYPDLTVGSGAISYGNHTPFHTLVDEGSPVNVFVPPNGNLGALWIQPEFDDSGWSTKKLGVGFGSRSGQFNVVVYKSNLTLTSVSAAARVLSRPTMQSGVFVGHSDVINFWGTGPNGRFGKDHPFPGQELTDNVDNFVVHATAVIEIPADGWWTFGVHSDDGARLRIDGNDLFTDSGTASPHDTLVSVQLSAGLHELDLLHYDSSGGATLELFAAFGRYTSFNPAIFHLVGDDQNGGLALNGFAHLVNASIQNEMQNQNASVFLRIPFLLPDSLTDYYLTFQMRYDDGFVAWINGREIARRNALATLEWNSTALTDRPDQEASDPFTITIPDAEQSLRPGINWLAVHGLNANREDDDFLIHPTLHAVAQFETGRMRYFTQPTPGEANGEGLIGFLPPPTFSHAHGFYEEAFSLALSSAVPDVEIRYTTDGNTPDENRGLVYHDAISITTTTPVRAVAYKDGYQSSPAATQTYIFFKDVIRQTRPDGYPVRWGGGVTGDYDMDPDVVNHADYRDTIVNDLRSIPSFSIVMNFDDLFDSRQGIYTNPTSKGDAWERAGSAELIFPDGRVGFQSNSGVQIQGNNSRNPNNRKHSFRVKFKREYGPPKLEYKLYDDADVSRFDSLTLRGGFNYTWHAGEGGFNSSVGKAEYMRDVFSRQLQRGMGRAAFHGRYVHLYLNGMYWGLYDLCETPDESFCAEHIGGDKDEWDVISSGTSGINYARARAGNKDAWNQMLALAEAGNLDREENYQAIQQYTDIDNLIDYMLAIYFTGNRDGPTIIGGGGTPWNFYAARRRLPGEGFQFFCWDSEWTLEDLNVNVVNFHNGRDNPARVFQRLKQNRNFLMRVADRIHKHFFNGGILTPEKSRDIYQSLATSIDRAIVGESARWGDLRYSSPRLRDPHWTGERDRILNDYLPFRSAIVLEQLRSAGLYPTITAPVFNRQGGEVEAGFPLVMLTPGDEILTIPLVTITDNWKFEQSGADLGAAWRAPDFNDSRWRAGQALFYVETSELPAPKSTALTLGAITYYFRKNINVNQEFDRTQAKLLLNMVIDDGAVIYLNGEEIHRIRMADGPVAYIDFSNQTVGNATYEDPIEIPIDCLRTGGNTIAVEVHQANATSSDVVFGLTLDLLVPNPNDAHSQPIYYTLDGGDPRLPGGALNTNSAILYTGPVRIDQTIHVCARTRIGEEWSALNEASFSVRREQADIDFLREHLRITELMYNPTFGNEYEFIELHNTRPFLSLSLGGLAFTEGISFSFSNTDIIPAGGYLLLAKQQNKDDFRERYHVDDTVLITGPYDGQLANEGERLELIDAASGESILAFEYGDGRGWPVQVDGAGHSLIPKSTAHAADSSRSLNYGGNWRASAYLHGSPGASDPDPIRNVVLNEFMAFSKGENLTDWIELLNTSGAPIHLNDWYLSDENKNLTKWPLPAIDLFPHVHFVVDKTNVFANPIFTLNEQGGKIMLSYLPGIYGVDRVVDAVRFAAQESDKSLGRSPLTGEYWLSLLPSPNEENSSHIPGVVIDEIMYHPPTAGGNVGDVTLTEFIELYNSTNEPISLFNARGPWRVDGGIRFEFPQSTILSARERLLLVGFDPNDAVQFSIFLRAYNLDDTNTMILGPYEGKLSNLGERIALEKPQLETNENGPINGVIVDEVIYFDQSPWPPAADGDGMSLQRISASHSGNDPANWSAEAPTPGISSSLVPVLQWSLF